MPRMRLRAKRSKPAMPRTVMGLWLRAFLLRDARRLRELTAKLNGGKRGWSYDEAGVVQAASELAVRRFFGTHYDVRAVTEVVLFIRDADQAGGKTPHGQLEMEAVIRSALGEADVDTGGINPQVAFEIQGAITAYIVFKLGISAPEVVRLICEAEQIAFERGSKPPLAV
jgi:hypothetical protein